ncbi:MAG: hypothetical protein WBO45_03000 [Planctomycetota bacterium]
MADVGWLALAAGEFERAHGRWPSHDELLANDPTLARQDRWRHPFRFEVTPHGFVVTTAGIDGEFGTCDDVASDPVPPSAASDR